jgi:hypothetical protein
MHSQRNGSFNPCFVGLVFQTNIALEEDMKEIIKSAWLKSILFIIETAGLKENDASTRIQTIIDSLAPGKYIGVNAEVREAIPLDLEPDFAGLNSTIDSFETKIYKSLHVPQFLVQSEEIANRATADKSAQLFIDGVVAYDQEWMSDILWDQHYEPLARRILKLNQNVTEDDTPDEEQMMPFKIKRIWDKPTISEFLDLATAVSTLVQTGIWDEEQANKVLETDDVTPRILKAKQERQQQMFQPKPEEETERQKQNAFAKIASAADKIGRKHQ